MKLKRSITALGAFFVLGAGSLGIAACGSSVPGDAVANVAGNPISVQAFNHWMFVAAKSQAAQSPGQPVIVPEDPPNFTQCIANVRKEIPQLADPKKNPDKTIKADCANLFTSLSSQVLDFLITSYWYQADAAKQHITVSDAQVLKAFNTAKSQQFQTASQYQSFLSQTGQTQADILYRFRINQIYTKLLAKHTTAVTPAAISAYYQAHLSQFGTPETRDLRIVLAKNVAGANAAKAALAHGQSWTAVAKKYSTDTSTNTKGGLLLGVVKGQQDAALDTAAFSAPQGVVLGPVKGQFGYYVFEVIKVHAATQQTLTQATPTIRQTLTSTQQNTASTAVQNAAKKTWLSQTTCRSGYQMADCKGYKAPKSSTTGTTSTG
jgi:foldase protein PrsA